MVKAKRGRPSYASSQKQINKRSMAKKQDVSDFAVESDVED
jgi:hypothetical protein